MSEVRDGSAYALGYTEDEHRRLTRQSAIFAPCTEQLFRTAGIGPGSRVLELGSGGGDVSLLLSTLVGPTGSITGIERDRSSIARAEARLAAAGRSNVRYVQSEATAVDLDESFDALTGRFILMYLPEPAAILRNLARFIRPGGAVAFLEPSWAAARGLAENLPLYAACAAKIVALFKACGVDPDIGTRLNRIFAEAGLPKPSINVDVVLGSERLYTDALVDILRSLAPQGAAQGITLSDLGILDQFGTRLQDELMQAGSLISFLAGTACAWCRLPDAPGVRA